MNFTPARLLQALIFAHISFEGLPIQINEANIHQIFILRNITFFNHGICNGIRHKKYFFSK